MNARRVFLLTSLLVCGVAANWNNENVQVSQVSQSVRANSPNVVRNDGPNYPTYATSGPYAQENLRHENARGYVPNNNYHNLHEQDSFVPNNRDRCGRKGCSTDNIINIVQAPGNCKHDRDHHRYTYLNGPFDVQSFQNQQNTYRRQYNAQVPNGNQQSLGGAQYDPYFQQGRAPLPYTDYEQGNTQVPQYQQPNYPTVYPSSNPRQPTYPTNNNPAVSTGPRDVTSAGFGVADSRSSSETNVFLNCENGHNTQHSSPSQELTHVR